ncbi:MAG: EamA family transporter [Gemmatimonadota bacterium]|nr:EamA family transporter [Gemmatimonadota bacterium]
MLRPTEEVPLVSATSLLLVLISVGTHAYWNYLLKRSGGGQLFVGLSKIAEVVLLAPVFLFMGAADAAAHFQVLWPLAIVGAALTLTNYGMLAIAYERGDLSLVYPISRGAVLLFLPILGFFVFGEHVDAAGWVAIAAIIAGIVVLQLPALDRASLLGLTRRVSRSAASGYALLAALAAAGYTVWDKRAVGMLSAFTYFYSYTVLVGLAYAIYIAPRYDRAAIASEWRAHRAPIVQVGILNTITYLLVLVALRTGVSSYVVGLRQLSVGVGALLGWQLLGEELGLPKRVGIAMLIAGSVLVALAR